MLNTLFTLQELCHLSIKKIVCFLYSPPSKRNPCSVDHFVFLLATLVESGNLLSFLHRWILIDINCTAHFWGQCRSCSVELNFTVHQYAFLLLFFFNYRILLMAGFVAFFPSVRSNIWSTEKDSDLLSSLISTVIS